MFDNQLLEATSAIGMGKCKPNYEEMAKNLRKQIEADSNFKNAIKEAEKRGVLVSLHREERKLLYALHTSLEFRIEKKNKELDRILDEMEKE